MRSSVGILGLIFCLVVSATGFSAEMGQAGPIAKAERFLSAVEKGKVDSAYDELFKGSSITSDKPQAVETLKKQTALGISMFGQILEYELVGQKVYGKSVVKVAYILKTKKGPLTWVFTFYRPQKDWFIVNVNFNDELKGIDF